MARNETKTCGAAKNSFLLSLGSLPLFSSNGCARGVWVPTCLYEVIKAASKCGLGMVESLAKEGGHLSE